LKISQQLDLFDRQLSLNKSRNGTMMRRLDTSVPVHHGLPSPLLAYKERSYTLSTHTVQSSYHQNTRQRINTVYITTLLGRKYKPHLTTAISRIRRLYGHHQILSHFSLGRKQNETNCSCAFLSQ